MNVDCQKLINNLSEYSDKTEVLHQLALLSGYEERVPDIDTFIDDPYYLGNVLGKGLFPIWRDAARKLYPNPYITPAVEVYLTGGIGLGKSTFAKLIVLYDICKLLSLKDPHEYFGLLKTTTIRYMLMNATKGLSFDVLYQEIIEWVENSPFFKSHLSTDKVTLFKKKIDIGFGSRGKDALGQATVGAIFSEINDMTVVHGQAEDNFDTIYTRMNSRFGGKGRGLIGHLILDSSNKGVKSFIDVRLEEKKRNGDNDYMLFRFSHWEAKWHLGQYSGKFFRCYAGDENRDPFIIAENEDDAVLSNLRQDRIIQVPVEHRQEFKFNIIKSLRDLAGVSTFSTWSFITSVEVLNKSFEHVNPVTRDLIVLDFFDQRQQLSQYIDIQTLARLNGAPRFIHVDLGLKNDSTGIACCYLAGYKDVKVYDPISGNSVINREPIYFVEWVMEITAVPGHEVAIYKIKEFILWAKSVGYNIKSVSTDGFQSSNLRQDLMLRKIDTKLISVDRTKDPYDNLRNAILEERLKLPRLDKLVKELTDLEDTGDKYDHPVGGSKDVADAVCGSVWACSQNLHLVSTLIDADQLTSSLDALLGAMGGNSRDKFESILTSRNN